MKKYNTKAFIEKANIIHNNTYGYFNCIYKNSNTKVEITCSIHGKFMQTPANHLQGSGCLKCSLKTKTNTTKYFIEKSTIVHGAKYNYSISKYISSKKFIDIICYTHGEFKQLPLSHYSGKGCPKCSKNNKLTLSEFIDKSNKIHGDKYDYSKSEIINSTCKVKIICKKHGVFEQIPTTHYIKGSGCPNCKKSKGEMKIKKYLDEFKIKYEEQKKFDECKNVKCLPFDFYIPSKNTCIEFYGKQHFMIDGLINKTQNDLDIRLKCDKLKDDFCLQNKIRLIRIPYYKENSIKSIIMDLL